MSEFVPTEGDGVAAVAPASAETDPQTAQDTAEETEAVVDYEALVAERTADLQRLQAEYMNYKKRVDRDRGLAKQSGIETVMNDLMPVLDAIALAKQHDDLAHGAQLIVAELEKVAAKHGLVEFGAIGEPFDPARHEALMQHQLDEPVEVVTISQVIQLGYELAGRVIRPARVAVANP